MPPPSLLQSRLTQSPSVLLGNKVRFKGANAPGTPAAKPQSTEDLDYEKEVRELKKYKQRIAEKERRRLEKEAKYHYKKGRPFFDQLIHCYRAGYGSPLPLYQRPLAFFSMDNLQHGLAKAKKHILKKEKQGGFLRFIASACIPLDIIVGVITHGVMPLIHILFPNLYAVSTTKKFILGVQERAADKIWEKRSGVR